MGDYASLPGDSYGAFMIFGPCGCDLKLLVYDGEEDGWEHVSVSTERRIPNWLEMAFVKDLCWAPEECVVQYHPPKSDYINCHPFVLHLWRWRRGEFPRPPQEAV